MSQFIVTSAADDGSVGTLRWAIASANASAGTDEIVFSGTLAGSTIALLSDLPAITDSLTIDGSGAAGLIVTGGNAHRVFVSTAASLTISHLAIHDGLAKGGDGGVGGGGGAAGLGGGLLVLSGHVTLDSVSFDGNSAVGGNGGVGSDSTSSYAGGGGGGLGGNGGNGGYWDGRDHVGAAGGGTDGGASGATVGGGSFGGGGGGSGLAGNAGGNGGYSGSGAAGGLGGGGGGGELGMGSPASGSGGAGGLGGGGGGGGNGHFSSAGVSGGAGGFGGGGGGGGGSYNGSFGVGGFGGAFGGTGGTGGSNNPSTPGHGGGGGALGGAIFVGPGASITYIDTDISGSGLTAGAGGTGTYISANGTAGSASGTGIFLYDQDLSLAVTDGKTIEIQDTIADNSTASGGNGTASSLTKTGAGTLVIHDGDYHGTTTVAAGVLLVNGDISDSTLVTVNSGATLGGSGILGDVVVLSGAALAPGNSPGIIETGDLTLSAGSGLIVQVQGSTAGTGYDQVKVTGTVTLGGASLILEIDTGFAIGSDTLVLIDNDGSDAVVGTFNDYAEGASFASFNTVYQLSYVGGDGNDVTLRGVGIVRIGGAGVDSLFGGTGDDSLTGDAGNDSLFGYGGNDTLRGGTGADYMDGDSGNDVFYVDNAGDLVADSSGNDTVYTTASWGLSTGVAIEELRADTSIGLQLSGNELNNRIYGGDGEDTLYGLGGADSIDGGNGDDNLDGGSGADTLVGGDGDDTLSGGSNTNIMNGGAGNDTYTVDSTTDVIIDSSGIDRIGAHVDYTLSTGLEIEKLAPTSYIYTGLHLTGNELGNLLSTALRSSHASNTSLYGMAGNDTLEAYADNAFLDGGEGDDLFRIGGSTAVIADESGNDSAIVSTDWTLTTGVAIEQITVTAASSVGGNELANAITTGTTGNVTLSGYGGDDTLTGHIGSDSLDGGSGADSMNGGFGNDRYIVDDAGDVVADVSGNDTVTTSINWTLASGIAIELLESGSLTGLTLAGNELANTIIGGDGSANDSLSGMAGADSLGGLGGNDTLDGGTGADTMRGGSGNDVYYVDDLADVIVDDSGNDTVYVSISGYVLATDSGIEQIISSASGSLALSGNDAPNTLTGDIGNDTLNGLNGNDTLVGGDGNNMLIGGVGRDSMVGGTGNDTFLVDNIGDIVSDAGGIDRIVTKVNWTAGTGIEELYAANMTNGVRLVGNNLSNTVIGSDGADTLYGLNGHDRLDGRGGADSMEGGTGNDTYVIDHSGDAVFDSTGVDQALVSVDWVAGAGVDRIIATNPTGGVNLAGNADANRITGSAGDDTLDGIGGHDSLFGGSGADNLLGGEGNDTLSGGAGDDSLDGGLGNDRFNIDDAGDVVADAGGADTVYAYVNWTMTEDIAIERLIAGSTSLALTGNELTNNVLGSGGMDTLSGLAGNDTLNGGVNDDVLIGGADTDYLTGGAGNDTFTYLSADDSPVGTTADRIMDFSTGDRIDVSAIDAFTFIGADAFSRTAGELRAYAHGSSTIVAGDIDGDGAADFQITLVGTHSLTSSDFILLVT